MKFSNQGTLQNLKTRLGKLPGKKKEWLKKYGRKRLVIIHEQEDLQDVPRFLLTNALGRCMSDADLDVSLVLRGFPSGL